MDFTPIYKFFAPKGDLLEPPPSSHPIIIDGYELRPDLIAMVQEQSFFRLVDEDPYTHLREFKQLCLSDYCWHDTRDTIKWKLFAFSLLGRAKQWYAHFVGGVNGNWEELQEKFCLAFFPLYKIADLRIEVLQFQQKEKEAC